MADDEQDMPPQGGGGGCCKMSCSCGRMVDMMISNDIFAKKPELRLPDGSRKYNTFFGCCFSYCYFAILVGFIFLVVMGLLEIDKNHLTSITYRDTLEQPTATIMK